MNIMESFAEYFAISIPSTEDQLNNVFRIRYRVYCDEFKFLPHDVYTDNLEKDEFDKRSIHILITHKSSNTPAGCVRFVPVYSANPELLLPLEKFCPDCLDKHYLDLLRNDRDSIGEISRLAVDSQFRRRQGEDQSKYGQTQILDLSPEERRSLPLISIILFLCVTAVVDLKNRPNVFAMMEPFLPKRLSALGFKFQQAGQEIDYHGVRAPYFSTLDRALSVMAKDIRTFYDTIKYRIRDDINSAPDFTH
ncbi:PEP-CTERM/exosortase system-associated acyltransferase [candidate division KSB1 bacterium]|nr:PEP-CTERM/exosortase system-associated acyltransferase [candidate division KSB1 bacterium]